MNSQATKDFVAKAITLAQADPAVLGIAVAGSAITNETDEYSDLDLVVVSRDAIAPDRQRMREFAQRLPGLIADFTGEHVGEKRLLICLYENPLLHVDFKFLQRHELADRVENPKIIFERGHVLTEALANTQAHWPQPDLQWIEDRFWVWIHYAALKLGRGEYFEALDCISFLRGQVLGPLLHMKYGRNAKGVRRLEQFLSADDLFALRATLASHTRESILNALNQSITMYSDLRGKCGAKGIQPKTQAESAACNYLRQISG